VDRVCGCGSRVTALLQDLSCLRCGEGCCPACAFAIDSATYCVRCAEAILEAEGVSLNLSLRAGSDSQQGPVTDTSAGPA
jgi:hypothetical protein